MTINTNVLSLTSREHSRQSQQSLQTAMGRLSSGLRINSASDDAAGLAIANRMEAQVRGTSQANRNVNDAISLAQTAEGAIDRINDNLQRIRELTVQAANGTNSQQDQSSILAEVNQRLAEIDRVAGQTTFNGTALLSENRTFQIQTGANDGQTFPLELADMGTTALGLEDFSSVATEIATAFEIKGIGSIATGGVDIELPTTFEIDGEQVPGKLYGYQDSEGRGLLAAKVGEAYYDVDLKISFDEESKAFLESVTVRHKLRAASDGQPPSPLDTLDAALEKINDARSSLGAQQNRLASIAEGNTRSAINLASAMSRIEDADYAREVAEMTKAQILQQASTSILAQANQVPQNVLSLLE